MTKVDKIHTFVPTLIIEKWTKVDDFDVYVFDSHHCFGSIGVFVPALCLLFAGDNRVNATTINTIKKAMDFVCPHLTIKGDDFQSKYKNVLFDFPSPQASTLVLKNLLKTHIKKRNIWIILASCSAMEVLPLHPKWRYKYKRCGNNLPDFICEETYFLLGLNQHNQNQTKIYISRSSPCNVNKNFLVIKLSALFWFYSGLTNYSKPFHVSEDEIRVFVCFHASERERLMLQSIKD